MPGLLPTPRHVGMAIALTGAIAMFTGTFAMTLVLRLEPAAAEEIAASGALLVLAASATRLTVGFDPRAAVAVYESPDLVLLSRTAITGRDLAMARGFLRRLIPDLLATTGTQAAVLASALFAGVGVEQARVLLIALVTWPVAGALSNATGILVLRLILRLPTRFVPPAIVSFDAVGRIVIAGILVLLAPAVVDVLGVRTIDGAIVAALGHPAAAQVLTAANEVPVAFVVVIALSCLGLAAILAAMAAPSDPLRVQRRLTEGVRWRLNVPFGKSTAWTSADKDSRLLVRRGLPAWQTIEDLLGALPFVVGLALAGQGVITWTGGQTKPLELLTLLANASAVVAVLGLTSESLQPFLSLDTDGPTVRVLKGSRKSFGNYLGARATAGGAILGLVTLVYLILVHAVAPWPGSSILGVAVMAGVAVAAEAVVVVTGSAHRPALFRPTVGLPQLEPSVRLASGVVLIGVIALTGPVVLVTAGFPGPPTTIAPLVVFAVMLIPVLLTQAIAGAIYNRLERGPRHVWI